MVLAPQSSFLRRLSVALSSRSCLKLAAKKRASVAIVLRVVGESAIAFRGEKGFLSSAASLAPKERVEILFIQRSERLGDPWSGHIAFPGGKREEGDADDAATAAREAMEETGIDVRELHFMGALHDRRVLSGGRALPNASFSAFVWVAGSDYEPSFRLETAEVAAAWWEPLSTLEPQNMDPQGVARPALRAIFGAAGASAVPEWTRLHLAMFPAIKLRGAPKTAPPLWGMTLTAVNDLIVEAGDAEVAWPPVRLHWPWHGLVLIGCGAAELFHLASGTRRLKDATATHLLAFGLVAVGIPFLLFL